MRTCAIAAAAWLICVSGCIPYKTAVLEAQKIAIGNELADVLSRIKDEKSATEWKPRLKKMCEQFRELDSEMKKEDPPKEKEYDSLVAQFEEDRKVTKARYDLEVDRINKNGEAWKVLQDVIKGFKLDVDLPKVKGKSSGPKPDPQGGGAPPKPQGG
jgi:hypothetical protein